MDIQPTVRHRSIPHVDGEQNVLAEAFPTRIQLRRKAFLVREGEPSGRVQLLKQGMAVRFKTTSEGSRQIVGIVMPGDICDLSSIFSQVPDHSIEAVTDCEIAIARMEDMVDLMDVQPRLGLALLAHSLADATTARVWILNNGRRTARQRIAHLICEIFTGTRGITFASGDTCTFPLTQEHMADATGLSIVYVNQNLQEFRSAGLISLDNRILVIHDWEKLSAIADFRDYSRDADR